MISFLKILIFFSSLNSQLFSNSQNINSQSLEFNSVLDRGPSYYTLLKNQKPQWLIVAGRKVIPGSLKRIVVQSILTGNPDRDVPIIFKISLVRNNQQITFGQSLCQAGQLSYVLIKVPENSVDGDWRLQVTGTYEDNLIIFKNSSHLAYYEKFLTILIQTSRPIYNAGQTVNFRVILLNREFKPYDKPITIYILDPSGLVMRRWPSQQPANGIASLKTTLPEFPSLGEWKIRVQALSQVQDQPFIVEQYFQQRFEVYVRFPHVITLEESFLKAVIIANMTNGRNVYGNITMKLEIQTNSTNLNNETEYELVYEDFNPNFNGVEDFIVPMGILQSHVVGDLHRRVVRVLAIVGEAFGWRIEKGWAEARLIDQNPKVSFLGEQPMYFVPGMPYTIHIKTSYEDEHPMTSEELTTSSLVVTLVGAKESVLKISGDELAEKGGIVDIRINVPEDSASLQVNAKFRSNGGIYASSDMIIQPQYSLKKRYLVIETSTNEVEIGSFMILHVRNNFYVSTINYMVISKGVIICHGQEPTSDRSYPSVTTFSLTASAEMSPVAKMFIWVFDQDGEIISNSIAIPITPLSRHQVDVGWNEHKDHSGLTAEVQINGEIGAYFATVAVWEEIYLMNSDHDLSEQRVLRHMMDLNDPIVHNYTIPHIKMSSARARDGSFSQVKFFPTSMSGPDSHATFYLSDLIFLTDAKISYHPGTEPGFAECDELYCLSGGCYQLSQRCNGVYDCTDQSDEAGCPLDLNPDRNFRLNRINRHSYFYDVHGNNWGWQEILGESEQFLIYNLPRRPQSWYFNVIAMGKETGLGIYKDIVQVESHKPFILIVEGPPMARMWEQIGVTVSVFNFHHSPVGVLIKLPQSDNYNVISVEGNGVVESYNPRKLIGTFQHILWLMPKECKDIHIPIIFTTMGDVTVIVEGITQMQRDSFSITIPVEPEGASIGQHTSVLLDLKNRALTYEFFNIHLDETPVIPYTIQRRYVFSTPAGTVSISGDVVGPIFPEMPVNSDNLMGFDVVSAETSAYNFAANIWSLHYLRLTNQLTDPVKFKVLSDVTVDYAALSRYQTKNGGFTNWIGSEESVWLTAHTLRCLSSADFQDWENYIFVDPLIVSRAVKFLIMQQTLVGSFAETLGKSLDPKVDPAFADPFGDFHRNISITAQVVLALTHSMTYIQGDLHRDAILSKSRAVRYLESSLPFLTDPYHLAVVAWALTKANSNEKEVAFSYLDSKKRMKGDMVYWSRGPIIINPIIYEDSQRAYLNPIEDNEWDSMTIETTSYALMVYVKREGINIIQENIVRFLASMRHTDGGFLSTVDSIVAMEALVEYSYRSRLREVTDMAVTIELSADSSEFNVKLTNEPGFASPRVHELSDLWGHLNIIGKGSGQALIQLDYSYGVDVTEELDEAVVTAFELDVSARYFGRNNSHVQITSCQRWINTAEANASGAAVVEIHLPSGYHVVLSELLSIVNSGSVQNLRWARRTAGDIKFFFSHLTTEFTCFSYQIDRWYPVANHSRFNLAQVYELYQPERFQMQLFEVFPLYVLDICEVCGSFQCPYCPFYSEAEMPTGCLTLLLFMVLSLYILSDKYYYS